MKAKLWQYVLFFLLIPLFAFSLNIQRQLEEPEKEAIQFNLTGVHSVFNLYTTQKNVNKDFENHIRQVMAHNNWNVKTILTDKNRSGITYTVKLQQPMALNGLDFSLTIDPSSLQTLYEKPVPIMVNIPKPFFLELSPRGTGAAINTQLLNYRTIVIALGNSADSLTIRGSITRNDIISLLFKAIGILVLAVLLFWGYIIRFYNHEPKEYTLMNLMIISFVFVVIYYYWLMYTGYYTFARFYFGFVSGGIFALLPFYLGLLILFCPLFVLGVRLKHKDANKVDIGRVFLKMSAIKVFPLFLVLTVQIIWFSLPVSYSNTWVLALDILTLLAAFIIAPCVSDLIWRAEKPAPEIERLVRQVMTTPVVVRIIDFHPFKEANAAVTGVLPGLRRLYLTRDILEILTPDELKAIICHEEGHLSGKHTLAIFAVIVLLILAVKVVSYYEYSSWAYLGLVVVFPLALYSLSRWFEHRADLYAALRCGPTAIISALSKIQAFNAPGAEAEETIISTHPALEKRVAYILRKGDLHGK